MRFMVGLIVFYLTIPIAVAHEVTEKVKRLEITVEQLSVPLAEKTAENKRLTAAMAAALVAQRSGSRVVTGCDTKNIEQQVAFTSGELGKQTKLVNLLREEASKCTKDQLRTLEKLARTIVYNSDSIPIIKYYLNN